MTELNIEEATRLLTDSTQHAIEQGDNCLIASTLSREEAVNLITAEGTNLSLDESSKFGDLGYPLMIQLAGGKRTLYVAVRKTGASAVV